MAPIGPTVLLTDLVRENYEVWCPTSLSGLVWT